MHQVKEEEFWAFISSKANWESCVLLGGINGQ